MSVQGRVTGAVVGGSESPPGEIRNELDGTAQTVVQLGVLYGDLRINIPSGRELPPLPRQVPGALRRIVDRRAELRRWSAMLDAAAPPLIIACTGPAGIGKSTVARVFAHQHRDRFPGGQIYVDFGPMRRRGGAAVGDALGMGLRGLGVQEDFVPDSFQERLSLYRTRTGGAAVLVYLGNVTEPEQARAFLPNSAGSVLLVTSEDPLTDLVWDDAHLEPLAPLESTDAVMLLRRSAGPRLEDDDRGAVDRLVRHCRGLPLALLVAGSRLASTPGLSVSEFADQLRGVEEVPVTSVAGVVASTSYGDLDAPASQVVSALACLPGTDFGFDAAVAVTHGLDVNVPDVAQSLIGRGLLIEGPRRRWRLVSHTETAAFAPPDGPLVRQSIEHYRRRAVQADLLVMGTRTRVTPIDLVLAGSGDSPPFARSAEALDYLDEERHNLYASAVEARRQGWDDLAWQLAETATALFFTRRHPVLFADFGELGAAAARALRDARAEARLLTVTSRAQTVLGRHEAAAQALQRALVLAESANDGVLAASVWEFRGRALEAAGEDPVPAFLRAVSENESAGEQRGASLARLYLGDYFVRAGRWRDGLPVLETAWTGLVASGDRRMSARALAALCRAQAAAGHRRLALAGLAEALTQLSALGMWSDESAVLQQLATVLGAEGQMDEARQCLIGAIRVEQGGGGDTRRLLDELVRWAS